MAPLQGMAESRSQNGGTSVKLCVEKSHKSMRRHKEKTKKQQCSYQSHWRTVSMCSTHEDRFPTSSLRWCCGLSRVLPNGGPHWNRCPHCSHWNWWIFDEGAAAHQEPMLEQVLLKDFRPWRGNSHWSSGEMWGGRKSRELRRAYHSHQPQSKDKGAKSERGKLNLKIQKEEELGGIQCCFNAFCLPFPLSRPSFFTNQIYFNLC